MQRKKIMILGGGTQQLPLLQKAKELGYAVVLCDYLPDCPGKKYCDTHYLASTYDREALLSVAARENVDGVISNSEPVQMNVSYLTDTLGLPSVPTEVMERFRNKAKMRDFLTPLGLSDVCYRLCMDAGEACRFFTECGGRKMVLKPLDNSASRGVCSVHSTKEIEEAFGTSAAGNRAASGVLIEEYLEGVEFTVDGLALSGKHHSLGISRKKHFPDRENVACELLFSHEDILGEYDYDLLRAQNDRLIEAAGLPYGMTHAEYKYAGGKFHLIEVAARGGGAFIATKIVPYLSGVDTVRLLLEAAVGEMPPSGCLDREGNEDVSGRNVLSKTDASIMEKVEAAKGRAAVLSFFHTPGEREGGVREIEGLSFLETYPDILKYELRFSVGDKVGPPENDAARIGYYIALSPSVSALQKCMAGVEEHFRIVF